MAAAIAAMPSFGPGQAVFVPDEDECYVLAKVSAVQGATVTATKKSGDNISTTEAYLHDPYDEEQGDLVQMTNVDPANMLNTLRVRHKAGHAYTNAGQRGIVVSVNPYKWIDIYGTSVMREYHEVFGTKSLPPHVFALASDAYKAMCTNRTSQTIITSGESGSGKTENSKQVFRFLAEIAGVHSAGSSGTVTMQELLVHANPVLEAFGNAKTLRNDNSSRFGKLVNVHFDGSGKIIGATTRNYLLEKTRVSAPPSGERNYHAFYQLLSGLSGDEKSKRALKAVADHSLLTRSDCVSVDGMDDAEEWGITIKSMEMLGFAQAEIEMITDITAACLVLADAPIESDKAANVMYRDGVKISADEMKAHGDDPSKLGAAAKGVVASAAGLLGVDADALGAALISIQVRDTTNILSVRQAIANRDAFVQSVYSRMFDRMVERINGAAGDAADAMEGSKFIGVLDIFGFEIFKTNSFEQLCINYANEKLQRNFTTTTFHSEEGLYTEEGIDFEHIEYVDNGPTLELLDNSVVTKLGAARGTRGLFQILDEEVHLPKTTDQTLLQKLNVAFGSEAGKAGGHPMYSTDFKRPGLFTVRHYAGPVEYAVEGFLAKSEESISLGLVQATKASSKPLVSSLFTMQSARRSVVLDSAKGGAAGSKGKPTVGLKFTRQLNKLLETIEETEAHFIRCVKPNTTKSASAFEPKLTLEQLKYSGVFEAVEIRKKGYPFRLPHRQFAYRYACLLDAATAGGLDYSDGGLKATLQKMVASLLPTAPMLLKAADALAALSASRAGAAPPPPLSSFDTVNVKVGKGKTFYRAFESRCFELAREDAILPRLATICRYARGLICRGAKRRLRACKAELEAAAKAKQLARLEPALEAALVPQRGFYQKKALDFSLFLPNRAELTQLVADLREEERLEPSLAALCEADDLSTPGSESFEKLKAELIVGKRLKEALGREVPHLQAAECVVGLTDGVLEHDHERLGAAMASAVKLGYASKLQIAMEKAKAEAARLEDGKVIEAKLRGELASHTSTYNGKGGWDHSNIQTSSLQAAMDEGVAFPLVSKQGLALIAQTELSLQVRPLLLADDWAGLVMFLEDPSIFPVLPNVDRKTSGPAEIKAAWNELEDQMESRTSVLKTALSSGKSCRIGEFKWDHKGIATAPVLEAAKAVESFPYKTDAGNALLAAAAAVVPLRKALLGCDWTQAATWGVLADTLEKTPQALRENDEVQATWSELFEMRSMLEASVTKHLESGRSIKRTGGAIGWSHDEIATEPLAAAQAELDAFPRPSDEGKSLSARASRAIPVRKALLTAVWSSGGEIRSKTAETWDTTASCLEKLGEPPLEMGSARDYDEALVGRQELEDARAYYEGLVRGEMAKGRSVKAGDKWSHGGVSTEDLEMAILECMDFLQTTRKPSTEEVLAEAQLIVELRVHLQNSEWDDASTWEGLADFLEQGIDADMHEMEEVKNAKAELNDRRVFGEQRLQAALSAGQSVRVSASSYSHDKLDTANLSAALAEVRAFPRVSERGTALAARADAVLPIRAALMSVQPESAATWGPVWRALEAVPVELRDDDEVCNAWEEILDARHGFEKLLKQSLAKNRSMRTDALPGAVAAAVGGAEPPMLGKAPRSLSRSLTMSSVSLGHVNAALTSTDGVLIKPWSHEELSTEGVSAALAELRAFPKTSDAGEALGKLADATVELRSLLGKTPWDATLATDGGVRSAYAQLAQWLEAAGSGPYSANEEIVAAMQEFSDKRTSIEAAGRKALDVGRSEAPSSGKANASWSHSALDPKGLAAAHAELTAFPRSSEAGKALAKLLHVMIALREALATCDWQAAATWKPLADALDSAHAVALAQAEPVAQVVAEFNAKRAQTEAAVQTALETGRATAQPSGGWDHGTIKTDALEASRAELDAFPRVSEAGKKLSAQATIALDVREALLVATYDSAESWANLAMCLDAHTGRGEAAGMQELLDAGSEFDYARVGFEEAISQALSRGRVTRKPASGTGTSQALSEQWDHSSVSSVALLAAASEHDNFPRPSAAGTALAARARVAAAIREATISCAFDKASSWAGLFGALEQAGRQLSPDELALLEDAKDARDELNDARVYTELSVTAALSAKRSIKSGGTWSHADLSATELIAALGELEAFPRMSEEGRGLASQTKQVVSIRVALGKADWESASTWGPLANALEAVPPDYASLEEIASARQELADKREQTMQAVRTEMGRCASVRAGGVGAGWDHSNMATAPLDEAAGEAAGFPRPAAECARLLEDAKTICTLRVALMPAKVGQSATWAQIAAFLGGAASASAGADELDEVRNAWAEVREARDAAESALTASLANGCSVSVGEATSWDHSKLDSQTLLDAAKELEAFPKIGAAAAQASAATAGSPQFSRRQSMLKRRESIVRVTEAAERLSASARTVAKIREVLIAENWAELLNLIGTLERAPPLHELCAEEARRANVELQDNLAMLENRVKACLDAKRSKRPPAGAHAWDHSELDSTELREAIATLRGFPLQRDASASLIKVGELVSKLRDALLATASNATAWGDLVGMLGAVKDADLMQHDEVRNASLEVDEMRQYVETELKLALEGGRSLKIVGKEVKVFVDKSKFLPISWDHASVREGVDRLKRAVETVSAFPGVSERPGIGQLLELASLCVRLRNALLKTDAAALVKTDPWEELSQLLASITLPSHLVYDEVVMARQEYLTHELERATKALDQKALKRNLAMATGCGMLPIEKPVYQALGVFIDPPEFVVNLPKPPVAGIPVEVGPDASGMLVLKVKVRGAKTIQWVKNGIALKEGADGGRIKGVEGIELTVTKMFPRDEGAKLQCIVKNKFGVVKSNEIKIRLGAAPVDANPPEVAKPPRATEEEEEDDDGTGRVNRVASLTEIHVHGDL